MAAPDAKSSPSNKEVQQIVGVGPSEAISSTKEIPPCFPTKPTVEQEESNAGEKPSVAPTYELSEMSEKYVFAKSLLASGNFEEALDLIEQAIQEAQGLLLSIEIPDPELHECMAPFHYLYGTTLLYSIEESNDTQMTVAQTEEATPPTAFAVSEPLQETQRDSQGEVNVEDMEIAWENLDTARNIVEAMLAEERCQRSAEKNSKLKLDLAQILLREGDLQRINGRYAEAIMDYEACLHIRQDLLPCFDRKIADVQYSLGLSYLSNSTEIQKDDDCDATKLKVGQEQCRKGVQLYVNCARTLCGEIALLCDVEPDNVLSCFGKKNSERPGLKTTGLNETQVSTSEASQTISAWRQAVAALKTVTPEDPRAEELRELLDEIQETVDEAERSQQAVWEATKLKVMAQNAVVQSDDGTTVQIGFGQPSLSTEQLMNPATAEVQPMMVVKKRKKRDAECGSTDMSAKRSKPE